MRVNASKLEELVAQSCLIAPISPAHTESKERFVEAVRWWGVQQGTEIREGVVPLAKALKIYSKQCYRLYNEGRSFFQEHGITPSHRAYLSVAAPLGLLQAPLLGVWAYEPMSYTVHRGSALQRMMFSVQTDPLVHEYLHVYQHLLYDLLYRESCLLEPHNMPAGLIEPPLFGFQFRSPSYSFLKRFENRYVKKLIDLGQL